MGLIYVGVGLAVPILLNLSIPWLVSLNIIATVTAGTLGLVWFAVRVQQNYRRHLVEWTTDLRLLDAREFEWLVGEVYRREGWQVEEVGGHGKPDGNVDLRLRRGETKAIVQAKRWTSWQVGVDDVRGFAGTLMAEQLPGKAGHFVTLSDFTEAARAEADRVGIALVGGPELFSRAERLRRREPCPKCSAPMLLDRSLRGWWFRCLSVGCGGKRDLGSEPVRALELLTEFPE